MVETFFGTGRISVRVDSTAYSLVTINTINRPNRELIVQLVLAWRAGLAVLLLLLGVVDSVLWCVVVLLRYHCIVYNIIIAVLHLHFIRARAIITDDHVIIMVNNIYLSYLRRLLYNTILICYNKYQVPQVRGTIIINNNTVNNTCRYLGCK